MNHLYLAGHLGADPDSRFTPGGQKVTTLRIATNSYQNGQDVTTWWRVTCWGDKFDKILPHLKKGSAVIVTGEMKKPEIYTDKEGRPQIALEVTAESIRFSPFGKSERGERESGSQQGGFAPKQQSRPDFGEQTFQPSGAGAYGHNASYESFEDEDSKLPF
ncbi:single-stranded DNA-binding protein [Parachlamydia sp. AcF125]|uniref:single-stranded DNA-binding protein n=1 Tax=Parachlamydia sp. AcF125 TaxID=2795736 RepID=UPI001BC967AD|nr:single-stranded DNA-binding protein [Parachlamydia sp. AcF125]MBS4168282.1 Single-stranded DNA-binding protein A [Parachlamydia sp. AcF125]